VTLAGSDPELEHTTTRATATGRTAYLTAATAVAVLLVAAATAGPLDGPERLMLVRNLIGLTGLAAVGAAVIGARRAWTVAATWALGALTVGPRLTAPASLLTWPVQPASWQSVLTAAATALLGAALLGFRGART